MHQIAAIFLWQNWAHSMVRYVWSRSISQCIYSQCPDKYRVHSFKLFVFLDSHYFLNRFFCCHCRCQQICSQISVNQIKIPLSRMEKLIQKVTLCVWVYLRDFVWLVPLRIQCTLGKNKYKKHSPELRIGFDTARKYSTMTKCGMTTTKMFVIQAKYWHCCVYNRMIYLSILCTLYIHIQNGRNTQRLYRLFVDSAHSNRWEIMLPIWYARDAEHRAYLHEHRDHRKTRCCNKGRNEDKKNENTHTHTVERSTPMVLLFVRIHSIQFLDMFYFLSS